MRPIYDILDADLLISRRKQTYRRASLLKRFLNLVIDYLAILHLSIFVGILLGMTVLVLGKSEWVTFIQSSSINLTIGVAIISIYYVGCEYCFDGKTLGKYVTRTTVRNVSGRKPSLVDVLIRTGYRLVPLEPISIFFGKKQSWHDSLSLTMVVEDETN